MADAVLLFVLALKVRPEGDAVCALDITVGEEQLLLGFGNSDIGIIAMASLYSTEDNLGRAYLGTSWQIEKIGKWKEVEASQRMEAGEICGKGIQEQQESYEIMSADTLYLHCGDLAQACLKTLAQASMQTAKDACH